MLKPFTELLNSKINKRGDKVIHIHGKELILTKLSWKFAQFVVYWINRTCCWDDFPRNLYWELHSVNNITHICGNIWLLGKTVFSKDEVWHFIPENDYLISLVARRVTLVIAFALLLQNSLKSPNYAKAMMHKLGSI